eukprot:TRINITY_DN3258_c0_g1_i1.p1 TRINITY_DN3258_c0_g1~~TRINITY_DN3258_c0_g1_i1.p1  ORF type:complete len:536 (-),score=123.82 TRINITY_DN3258_c0_g1_i1:55-1662(-)
MPAETQLAERTQGGGRQAEIEAAHQQKVLDTPRTREACKKLGLILEDLQYRAPESFHIPGDKKELQNLRFEHYEKKRKEKLAQVLAERAKVIATAARKGEVPGVQSGQFLSMLESLFEKEAKRLESDLKCQLRQHSSLVTGNEEQIRKEERLHNELARRQQKLVDVDKQRKDLAARTKERTDNRLAHNQELVSKLETDFQEKKAAHGRGLLAEEERMERFRAEQAMLSSEKSAIWKSKVQRIQDNAQRLQDEKRAIGEQKLEELETKIAAVTERREAEQHNRIVRSEEQHLHLMDVRAQKDRIDRVEGYRKNELREQIDTNVERIETLLALKDQLLSQRKARTIKAESTRGSRGIDLQRHCGPGPGQYEAPPSCMFETPCMKVSQSKTGHSEFIDSVTRRTADNPAPGAYTVPRLRNGDMIGESSKPVKFGHGDKTSFLDDAVKSKAQIPAPGRYELKSQLENRTTKMRRDKVQDAHIDKQSAKNFPVWARPGTDTPGPAGYNVDDFARKEVKRRVARSLPSLTKDMLKVGATSA